MSTVYYKGPGVLPFGGRDYRAGDELPAELGAEYLAVLVKKGKASTTAPAAPREATDEVAVLRQQAAAAAVTRGAALKQVEQLEGKLQLCAEEGVKAEAERNAAITERDNAWAERDRATAELDTALEQVKSLTAQLAQANETIEQLTAASLGGGQAGPKGAKK